MILTLFVAALLTGNADGKHETVKEMMRDAVLHDSNQVSFLGIRDVNPGFASAVIVSAIMLVTAALIRLFALPKFTYIPGRFQLVVEEIVGLFDRFAKSNSPHCNGFLGAYIFAAGTYIFFSTLFELFGVQLISTKGHSITLPAPLSDINAAIAMGCLTYLIILLAGFFTNGLRGIGSALKDFSMPLSMSFRLFGAMLGGVLITELVYYYLSLSFIIPILVALLFTLLHAVIQAFVLVMLTANTFGGVTEPHSEKTDRPVPVGG